MLIVNTLSSDYEELLGVMSALYGGDGKGLCEDYWHACVPSVTREPNTKQVGVLKNLIGLKFVLFSLQQRWLD